LRTANGTISTFDAPGAGTAPPTGGLSTKNQGTLPTGINTSGVITGTYVDSNLAYHGFVRAANGTITEFDVPGAITGTGSATYALGTRPIGINDSGTIVGTYLDTSYTYHGFVRAASGAITTFDAPGASAGGGTIPICIDAAGDVAGAYFNSSGASGFIRAASGAITEFNVPGAGGSNNIWDMDGTVAIGIDSAGDVAGAYTDTSTLRHGFLRSANGTVSTFDAPGAGVVGICCGFEFEEGTAGVGINTAGEIAGAYLDADHVYHGFLRSASGGITTFEAPNAGYDALQGTGGFAINASGTIAGTYIDTNNVFHGFIFTPALISTTTTLTPVPTPNPSIYQEPVTLTAAVSSSAGAPPNGENVTFMSGTTTLGTATLTSGVASLTTMSLPVGTDSITAVYGGDSDFSGSTSAAVSQTVNKASSSTTLTSSLNPSTFGQSVTFMANISGQFSGVATGMVTFYSGSTSLGSASVSNNMATLAIALPVGTDSITAVYSGDGNFIGSTSNSVNQVVNKATPTVTVTPGSSSITTAQSLSVTVAVSGTPTPTGTVTLTGGGYTSAATTLGGGSATIIVPAGSLAVGNDTLTASYSPDSTSSSTYNSASGTTPAVTVTQAKITPQEWNLLAPAGGPPGGRANASAIFDNATSQMIVFGGGAGSTSLNDTWSLEVSGSPQWKQLSPSGTPPQGRRGHTAVYDSANSRMIIFGGGLGNSSPCANDTWVLSNANSVAGSPEWTQLSPTGGPPSPRIFPTAGYDPGSNRMIVFGGNNCFSVGAAYYNDVWVLTNANGVGGTPVWTQLTTAGGPPAARENFGASYDAASNRLTIFGGWNTNSQGSDAVFFNDVWVLSNANGLGGTPTWTQLTPAGVPPSPRAGFATAADPASNRMLIFDGGASSVDLNETWVLSGANGLGSPAWTLLDPSGTPPSTRDSSTAVYDHSLNEFVIFGGTPETESTLYSDTWTLTATTPTVTVTPSASSITTAQALTVTVAVSGGSSNPTPTGSVTLTSGTYTSAATALVSGSATISIPAGSLAVGSDTLAATYTPDSSSITNYNSAAGSNSVSVTQAKSTPIVTVIPSPSSITKVQALSVTVTVAGTPTPTGSVTLSGGGYTSAATTLSSGSATINVSAGSLAVGGDTLTASYTPDSNSSSTYNSATGMSSTVTVSKAPPTVTLTPNPASITTVQSTQVTVTVSGGSGNPTPTGSVVLTSGSYTSASTSLSSGSATINVPAGSLAAGSNTLTATYTPDSNSSSTYQSATGSSGSVTVTKTTPTVSVTPGSSSVTTLQQLSVTITVNGGTGNPTPTGTVTLTSGKYTSAATSLSSGSATITISAESLAAGTDTFSVAYSGDPIYSGTAGTGSVTVTLSTASVTISPANSGAFDSSQSESVTVTVAGSGPAPTGTVTLSGGGYTSASTALNSGSASITIPGNQFTTAGNITLTANYGGDGVYASGSGTGSITVNAPYSLATTTPSAINPGSDATATITLTADPSYSGTVTFTCALATSPTGAEDLPGCSVTSGSPVTITNGTASGSPTVTMTTTAYSASLDRRGLPGWTGADGGMVLALLVFLGIPARRRTWRNLLGFVIVMATLGAFAACGGGGSGGGGGGNPGNPGTTAGNYTFTVTGAGTPGVSPAPTATVKLTVN
jgi:hypothetical protein